MTLLNRVLFVGETGNGVRMLLVVNMLMGTVLAGLAEAMSLAEKIGLDQDELLHVLDLSALSSPIIRVKGNGMYCLTKLSGRWQL